MFHVFQVPASSSIEPVEIAVCRRMSEVTEPGLELLERQNRFVSDNLRRIFVQVYRIPVDSLKLSQPNSGCVPHGEQRLEF